MVWVHVQEKIWLSLEEVNNNFIENLRNNLGYSINEDVYMDIVEIFDANTRTWSIERLSEPRAFPACAVLNDLVFFAGKNIKFIFFSLTKKGGGDDFLAANDPLYNVTDIVDIFNVTSKTWSTTRLTHPRTYVSAVSIQDIVMFAGGFDGNLPVTRIDIFNYTSQSWSTAETSQARDSIASARIRDIVLLSGM
jgi:hypothetical protein